jgi:hypothetical protein
MPRDRSFCTKLKCLIGSTQESPYDIHDLRTRERHKDVLMMVILDFQQWSIVNDHGSLYFSNTLDPHIALVQDVKTRWNSIYDILERFLYLQEPLKKVVEDEDLERQNNCEDRL